MEAGGFVYQQRDSRPCGMLLSRATIIVQAEGSVEASHFERASLADVHVECPFRATSSCVASLDMKF